MFDRYNRPVGYGQPTVFKDQPSQEPPGQPGRPPANPNLQNALLPQAAQNQPPSPSLINFASRSTMPVGKPQQLIVGQSATAPNYQQPQQAQPAPQPQTGYGQFRSQLEGFAHDKMDKGHVSPKYVYAEHASHFTPQQLATDPAARAALEARLEADPRGYFKDVAWTGNKFDRLKILSPLDPKFEGRSEFDTVRGAGAGGLGHQWSAVGGGNAQQNAQGQPFSYASYAQQLPDAASLSADQSDNFLQRLLATLQQQQK